MIVTDDYCNSAASDIMKIIEDCVDIKDDVDWIKIYDRIFDLLVDKFESNGYMNHN